MRGQCAADIAGRIVLVGDAHRAVARGPGIGEGQQAVEAVEGAAPFLHDHRIGPAIAAVIVIVGVGARQPLVRAVAIGIVGVGTVDVRGRVTGNGSRVVVHRGQLAGVEIAVADRLPGGGGLARQLAGAVVIVGIDVPAHVGAAEHAAEEVGSLAGGVAIGEGRALGPAAGQPQPAVRRRAPAIGISGDIAGEIDFRFDPPLDVVIGGFVGRGVADDRRLIVRGVYPVRVVGVGVVIVAVHHPHRRAIDRRLEERVRVPHALAQNVVPIGIAEARGLDDLDQAIALIEHIGGLAAEPVVAFHRIAEGIVAHFPHGAVGAEFLERDRVAAAIAGAGAQHAGSPETVGVLRSDHPPGNIVSVILGRVQRRSVAGFVGDVDRGGDLLDQAAHGVVGVIGDVAARVGLAQRLAKGVVGAGTDQRGERGERNVGGVGDGALRFARGQPHVALVVSGDGRDHVGCGHGVDRTDVSQHAVHRVGGHVAAIRLDQQRGIAVGVINHELDDPVAAGALRHAPGIVVFEGLFGVTADHARGDFAEGVVSELGDRALGNPGARVVVVRLPLRYRAPGQVVTGQVAVIDRVDGIHHSGRVGALVIVIGLAAHDIVPAVALVTQWILRPLQFVATVAEDVRAVIGSGIARGIGTHGARRARRRSAGFGAFERAHQVVVGVVIEVAGVAHRCGAARVDIERDGIELAFEPALRIVLILGLVAAGFKLRFDFAQGVVGIGDRGGLARGGDGVARDR